MAKNKSLIVALICVVLSISVCSLGSFAAESTPVINYAVGLTLASPWYTVHQEGSYECTTYNVAFRETGEITVIPGFAFHMLPGLIYSLEYDLFSVNGLQYGVSKTYGFAASLRDYEFESTYYNDIMEYMANTERHIACVPEYGRFNNTMHVKLNLQSTFESSFLDHRIVCPFNLTTDTPYTGNPDAFGLRLSSVTIAYLTSSVEQGIFEQIQDNARELEELGWKVDTVINGIDTTNQKLDDVKDAINENGKKLDNIDDDLNNLNNSVMAGTARLADELDKQNQTLKEESEKLQEDIKNVGKDTADAIADKEKEAEEDAKGQASDDVDKAVGDLNKADAVSNLDFVGKINSFYKLFSSENVCTTITFPACDFDFLGRHVHFWDEQKLDFRPFLQNKHIAYLISLVRLFSTIGLLFFLMRFYYRLMNSFLNKNSDESPMDVLFAFNPFRGGSIK